MLVIINKVLYSRPLISKTSGEWDKEIDFYQEEVADGMLIVIRRHKSLYHLCGYIVLPTTLLLTDEQINNLNVHGGITFSQTVKGGLDIHNSDSFFYSEETETRTAIGFDCAHVGDISPGMLKYFSPFSTLETYKDINFVLKETYLLHCQIKNLLEK